MSPAGVPASESSVGSTFFGSTTSSKTNTTLAYSEWVWTMNACIPSTTFTYWDVTWSLGSTSCPHRLVRVGRVCEQVAYGIHLYPVRGKNAPLPAERPRFGQRDAYCLDL